MCVLLQQLTKTCLKEIEVGNFRMDLYHRLSVILIHVPPLQDRRSDIPIIAQKFCEEICEEYGLPEKKITADAMSSLISLPWTGNIRELRNMIERLIILSEKNITQKDVITYANPGIQKPSNGEFDMFTSFQEYKDHTERNFIKYKLEKNSWNVSKTAEEIEIQRSHLYSKIEKFGLKREG